MMEGQRADNIRPYLQQGGENGGEKEKTGRRLPQVFLSEIPWRFVQLLPICDYHRGASGMPCGSGMLSV